MTKVDVEAQIDKALESAVDELREALIEIGEDAAQGERPFFETEKQFTVAMTTFACRMLAVLLSLYDVAAKYIRHQGTVWRRGTEKKPKTYRSSWGPLEVRRWTYLVVGESSGRQLVPLEQKAGLVEDCWTPQCAESMARLVQSVPPREAAENVEPLGVLPYARSSFERVAVACGQGWEHNRERFEDELSEEVDVPEQATGISVAFDRVRIEMDETVRDPDAWPNGRKQPRTINGRMAYCATVTLHDDEGRPLWTRRYGRNAQKQQGSKLPGVGEWIIREQVKWDVKALLEAKPELEQRAVALSDGGSELERIIDEDFPDFTRMCDIRHLFTYLCGALEDAGFSSNTREKVRRLWVDELKQNAKAIEGIEAKLSLLEGQGAADALTYIDNRRPRLIHYAEAHSDKLPIASGHVEATCKSLVQVRMRRCGQRWTVDSSQAILNLRTLALSNVWDEAMDLLMTDAVNDDFESCSKPSRRDAA